MRTLDELDVEGKRVLVRVDFNVPLEDGRITDDARIRAALPTLKELREKGARLLLAAHLGRPKDREPEFSLRPAAERLSELLGEEVVLAESLDDVPDGEIVMLENVRFEPGETDNDRALAERYAALADAYVNDAFGAAHRAHASTEAVAHLLPSAAGRLLEAEVATLTGILEDPERPLVAVVGGAKVTDKIGVLDAFLSRADRILVGGAMCFPFFKVQGHEVGDSLCEEEGLEPARKLLGAGGEKLRLPDDLVAGRAFSADTEVRELDGVDVPAGWMGLDIGERSAHGYAEVIRDAGTVFWNGPMGAFELDPFAAGTRVVAEAMAEADAVTVVGGGDSAAAMAEFGLADRVTHLSTGGGASLELIEGKALPGVEALVMTRTPFIAGNWKMNKTVAEAERYIQALLPQVAAVDGVEIVVCPPFLALGALVDSARGSQVGIYAQNMHEADTGAYTGEVSAAMLGELDVAGVVLGHSERRQYFNETDKALQLKVPKALETGLTPILCVGESEDERERGETERRLRNQVQEGLEKVSAERLPEVVIAYEPIWAIGTGKTATPDQAQEACSFIRALVANRDKAAAEQVRVVYGGSCKPDNAAELLALEDVDGALVGGASLDPGDFTAIVEAAAA